MGDGMRTMGVEEELLLVDGTTGEAVPAGSQVLAYSAQASTEFGVVAEMHEEMIELVSTPHRSLETLGAQLVAARCFADDRASQVGARAVPTAMSPFTVHPHPSPSGRHGLISRRYGATSLRCLTCGMHVHVKIRSQAEGVAVLDQLRAWLPVIRALTANSPFCDGTDSGYASYRFVQWNQWPSSGPSDLFGDLAGYRRAIRELLHTGALLDAAMLYPDIRLSNRFPTVEIRVADVPLRADTTVTIAGLVRGMVAAAAARAARGEPAPRVSSAAIRLASWTAALEGLEGNLVHPLTGRPAPAAEVVDALLAFAATGLVAHGDLEAVSAGIDRIFQEGTGAAVLRRLATASDLRHAVLAAAEIGRAADVSDGVPAAGAA